MRAWQCDIMGCGRIITEKTLDQEPVFQVITRKREADGTLYDPKSIDVCWHCMERLMSGPEA